MVDNIYCCCWRRTRSPSSTGRNSKEHTRITGLYIIEEKGVKVMRIMGERERERRNKERVHDGGT